MNTEIRMLARVVTFLTAILFAQMVLYSQRVYSVSNSWAESVPLPPRATLEIISENVQHNGQTLLIARLVSSEPVDSILDFYRAVWGKAETTDVPGYVEKRFGNWVAISRLEGGLNTVIQFNADASKFDFALVSVMSLNPSASPDVNTSSHPVNSELLSFTQTSDFGRDSTVEVLESDITIEAARQFYKSRFRRNGWNVVSDRSLPESRVLLFNSQSKNAEVYLGLNPGGSTLIVINQVIHDD